MTLESIKKFVLDFYTKEEIRDGFGDLRCRETWEAAYDRCKECAQAVIEVAAPCVEKTISAICTAIYWFIVAAFFAYFAGQALRQWRDRDLVAQAETPANAWLTARYQHPLLSSTVRIAGH